MPRTATTVTVLAPGGYTVYGADSQTVIVSTDASGNDGVISGIISDMGISWQYGRAFFIIPRVVGLAAHSVEETTRERPFRTIDMNDVTYDGPPERDLPDPFAKYWIS